MKIALLCATQRGLRVLLKLADLIGPETTLLVVSFKEDPWEPPFVEAIRATALSVGAEFIETKHVEAFPEVWSSVDLMLVVSWRFLIPASVYAQIKGGAYVFHDSLLPAYRGFAPTVWAIINGESHTGVSLFRLADEVDSGEIVAQRPIAIGKDEYISTVMERVTETYLSLLEETLLDLLAGRAVSHPQNHALATFTCRRLPEDNLIHWDRPTAAIYNLIRAVAHPYTGAYTGLRSEKLIVWKASLPHNFRPYVGRIPGRIIEIRRGQGVMVLTGDGGLLLEEVQLGNGVPQHATKVLKSISFTLGGDVL